MAGTAHTIFVGRPHEFDTSIFGIEYRHTGAGSFEIRAWVQQPAGQTLATDWYGITNAWHILEIKWESGTATTFSLSIDGTLHELTGVDTSAYLVDEVWLGPSQGLTAGMAGTEYFDDFNSFRPGVYLRTYLPIMGKNAGDE